MAVSVVLEMQHIFATVLYYAFLLQLQYLVFFTTYVLFAFSSAFLLLISRLFLSNNFDFNFTYFISPYTRKTSTKTQVKFGA